MVTLGLVDGQCSLGGCVVLVGYLVLISHTHTDTHTHTLSHSSLCSLRLEQMGQFYVFAH